MLSFKLYHVIACMCLRISGVRLTSMDFLKLCTEPTATDICITLEADSHQIACAGHH